MGGGDGGVYGKLGIVAADRCILEKWVGVGPYGKSTSCCLKLEVGMKWNWIV